MHSTKRIKKIIQIYTLKQGARFGRPKAEATEKFYQTYGKWTGGEITTTKVIKASGMKRTTFYKLVKQIEEQ